MRDFDYLNRATDEQVHRWMQERKDQLAEYRRIISGLEEVIAIHQAEIDNRALKRYWREHPELLPVNVGDKLLVTGDSLYNKLSNGFKLTVTDIVLIPGTIVCNIFVETDTDVKRKTSVSPFAASEYRRAFLESETYAT